jgi:DNA integrity scanning protein DisA with diadenylate cyclase activity
MEPSNPNANKISPFLLVIVMITLVLALAFIYMGLQAYLGDKFEDGSLNLTLGMALLAISTYLLFQTKRRPLKKGLEIQPLNTTVLCQKCGFKNVREFQRGDYVFKQMEDPCPKCNEKTLSINAIFREVKEKTKRSIID